MKNTIVSKEKEVEGCHLPVMLDETIQLWGQPEGRYFVDGTVGLAGHSKVLLERFPGAQLLGLDRDIGAVQRAELNLKPFAPRVFLRQGSYAHLEHHLKQVGFPEQVDGILLDLGLGSHQLDSPKRGFSFRFDAPLDMRFDTKEPASLTASDWLIQTSEIDLAQSFREYGELPQARRIARAIVQWRKDKPVRQTSDLVQCLRPVFARKYKQKDPFPRIFQAIRISVNAELEQLDQFLNDAADWLAPNGRLVVISFHSLEDRRIKQYMQRLENPCVCPSNLPICGCGRKPILKRLTTKPIQPSTQEIKDNGRARSARLRAAQKLP